MFGGFAPSYENVQVSESDTFNFKPLALAVRNGLSPLAHNKSEVAEIAAMVGGDAYVGAEASKDNFINNANNYNILHLAMHSLTDDNNPLNSRLIFTSTNDSSKTNYVKATELYNLETKCQPCCAKCL